MAALQLSNRWKSVTVSIIKGMALPDEIYFALSHASQEDFNGVKFYVIGTVGEI